MNIITFFRKYAYLKAVGFWLASSILMFLSFIIAKSSGVPKMPYGQSIVTAVKFGMGFVLLFYLCRAKTSWFLNNWKFNGKQIVAIIVLFLPIVIAILINEYSDNLIAEISNILHMLSTGFVEEIMYRGVFLVAFFWLYAKSNIKNPMVATVVFTGLFFGYTHLVNLLMGASFWNTFLQCNFAAFSGFAYAIFTVVTRNVWLPALMHGIYNYLGGFANLLRFFGFELEDSYFAEGCITIIFIVVFALLYDKSTGQNWVSKLKERFGDS